MPFTMPVSIAIVLGPDASSTQPPKALNFGGTIMITEIPAEGTRAFTMAEIAYDGKQLWREPLSTTQSQTLLTLLAQIPTENMSAPTRSFDGVSYNVQVTQEGASVVFHWSNEDWRYADDVPAAHWKAVATLAEYVRELKDGNAAT